MTQRKPKRQFFRRLRRDQRGAVALTFILTSTVMLGGSFGAIDLVRHNVAQGRLQNALDAAVISAGRNMATLPTGSGSTDGDERYDEWLDRARNFFNSNMPDGYLGSSVSTDDLVVGYREERAGTYLTGQFVDMSIRGDLPLISTGFMKITSFPLVASNEAVRRTRNDMEVVMALDNSGSMAGTRLATLKTAAKDLTETILGASSVPGGSHRVFVGLVPFSDVVNVGNNEYTRQWLAYPDVQENYVNRLWSGCIVEPKGDWTNANPLPASVRTPSDGFQPMHVTSSTIPSNIELPANARVAPDSIVEFIAPTNLQRDRRVHARVDGTSIRVNLAMEPTACLGGRAAHFLSQNQTAMDNAVDAMIADGNTIVPAGLLWAWRMLHPNWRGAWDGSAMPRNPEQSGLTKVIVLLTDGENVPGLSNKTSTSPRRGEFRLRYEYNTCTGFIFFGSCVLGGWSTGKTLTMTGDLWEEPNSSTARGNPITALKMQDPEDLSNNSSSIGWGANSMTAAAVNSFMSELCRNVKADGNDIKIYSVTLGNLGTAVSLMQGCASGPSYYFNAQNASDLPAVFATIAGALTELRLTQ